MKVTIKGREVKLKFGTLIIMRFAKQGVNVKDIWGYYDTNPVEALFTILNGALALVKEDELTEEEFFEVVDNWGGIWADTSTQMLIEFAKSTNRDAQHLLDSKVKELKAEIEGDLSSSSQEGAEDEDEGKL